MRTAAALTLLFLASVAQAQSPLDAVAEALGGAAVVDGLASVEVRAATRAQLDGTDTEVRSRRTLRPRSARWRVTVAGTPRVVSISERGVVAGEGEEAVAVDRAAAAQVRLSLWLDPLALALRRRELTAETLLPGLLRVRVPRLPEPLLVKLGPLGRPARISTFRGAGADRAYIEVLFADYREVEGLAVPHRVTLSEGGVVSGVTTVDRVVIERVVD